MSRWEKLVNRKWNEYLAHDKWAASMTGVSQEEKERILRDKKLLGNIDQDEIDEMVHKVYERVITFMPDSDAVEVKKNCQLGGKKNGTSDACDQGNIKNLKLKKI